MNRKDELIAAAQTIIQNADSILGNEEYQGDATITIYLNVGEHVIINVDRYIHPTVRISTQTDNGGWHEGEFIPVACMGETKTGDLNG